MAGVRNPRLLEAFAAVPREAFLGPGPWLEVTGRGYRETPSADPAHLYRNSLFAIDAERRLNNGEPASHAVWIDAAEPRAGAHIVHVGAGTGYYTAILAHMAGAGGRVTAIERDGALAALARENLAPFPTVAVRHADGAAADFPEADVIYVSAGATRPMPGWLDRLADRGRLVLPLTAPPDGAMFRIRRLGADFHATWLSEAYFIPGEGMRDDASEAALRAAFARGRPDSVSRLYRTDDLPGALCWARAPGWSLA